MSSPAIVLNTAVGALFKVAEELVAVWLARPAEEQTAHCRDCCVHLVVSTDRWTAMKIVAEAGAVDGECLRAMRCCTSMCGDV